MRFDSPGVALATIGLLWVGSAEAKPAVDRVNVRWLNSYDFEYVDVDDAVLNGSALIIRPESRAHLFLSRVALTLPITERIGGRVRAGGGAERFDEHYDFEAPFDSIPNLDSSIWSWQVEAGVDVFVRDPDLGYIDLGYSYTHQHFNYHLNYLPELDQRDQTGILAAGLFLTPAKVTPIDLDVRFVYDRVSLHRRTRGFTWPEYNLEATTSLYLGERVRWSIGGRFSYADIDPPTDTWTRDVRALMRLLWLPPIGGRNLVTIGLRATGGEIHERFAGQSFDRAVASIGMEIGLIYPGGDSLVRLVRERF